MSLPEEQQAWHLRAAASGGDLQVYGPLSDQEILDISSSELIWCAEPDLRSRVEAMFPVEEGLTRVHSSCVGRWSGATTRLRVSTRPEVTSVADFSREQLYELTKKRGRLKLSTAVWERFTAFRKKGFYEDGMTLVYDPVEWTKRKAQKAVDLAALRERRAKSREKRAKDPTIVPSKIINGWQLNHLMGEFGGLLITSLRLPVHGDVYISLTGTKAQQLKSLPVVLKLLEKHSGKRWAHSKRLRLSHYRRDLIYSAQNCVEMYKRDKTTRPPRTKKTARMVYDLMVKLSRLKE